MRENIFYLTIYKNKKSEKPVHLNLINTISDFSVLAEVILVFGQAKDKQLVIKNNKKTKKRYSEFFHRQVNNLMRNID